MDHSVICKQYHICLTKTTETTANTTKKLVKALNVIQCQISSTTYQHQCRKNGQYDSISDVSFYWECYLLRNRTFIIH